MSIKSAITKSVKSSKLFLSDNSPTILAGLSVMGVFTTAGLAIKATPEALKAMDEYRPMKTEDEPLTVKEVVKLTWKFYLPAAISAGLTTASILTGNSIQARRYAALASLYEIAQTGLERYQDKIVEVVGKNKAEKVDAAVAKDVTDNNPVKEEEIVITGYGNALFFDTLTGRYFRGDLEHIRQVVNSFNQELMTDMYKPVNDFFLDIGLDPVELGRHIGWDIDKGMLSIRYTTIIAVNSQPCIVLNYNVEPRTL